MKKLLIISGSARNGNSKYISESIIGWTSENKQLAVEYVKLSDYKINYCDGCLYCDTAGSCHQTDDMATLLEKVKLADGVIIVSPTRWSLLSGDLKVFFDRWNPLAGKNMFDGKKIFNICVGQTDTQSSISIKRALESLRSFAEDAGFDFEGQFAFENCYDANDAKTKTDTLAELKAQVVEFINKI